ncbi:MAG: glycosyltransferase [Candidatus Hermodarchaeota archaeon]
MIRILIVTTHYKKKSPGGAAQSLINIFNILKEESRFKINFFNPPLKEYKNLSLPSDIRYIFFIPKIIREINRFKPHIIITQRDIAYAAIISARLKKIPIINVVRDVSSICPKKVDTIVYGKACPGLINRKTCFDCINSWKELRVKLGYDKKGWPNSLNATFSIAFYKIKYFFCKLNIFFYKKATVNLVASELMKSNLSNNIQADKIKVLNITPINRQFVSNSVQKKNQFLFIINYYHEVNKGLEFVLELSKYIPVNYKIVIIGRKLSAKKIEKYSPKIINFGYVRGKKLVELFQTSKILLIPTMCTEAFGRAIIESIVNKTPVISSPNCGANYYVQDRNFIKIVPIKKSLWIKAIKETLQENYQITDNDVNEVYNLFSKEICKSDFINLIENIIK